VPVKPSETASYHLWLKPSGPSDDLLSRTIRRLAEELHAPVFAPHITLAGPLNGSEQELIERCDSLQRLLSPFEVVLDVPLHGPDYFRCVFMRADADAAIVRAHETARRVFRLPDRPFMPHLSLVYGNYTEAERQHIVSGLPPELRLTFRADSFDLILSTSLDPKDWRSVCSRRLG
jgi:2'-5' RNA ligase